ncbi:MAG: 1-deoxy-D-xylulose-5-phosphate reductoisomerase [Deltaproteobacteria bacterium]
MTLDRPKEVVILGSTGSIGQQALEVIDAHPESYRLLGMAARDEIELIAGQARKYRPAMVSVESSKLYSELRALLPEETRLICGMEGLCEMASLDHADIVLVALSGAIGIKPTLAAIKAGKRVALANKETLVAAGDIVMHEVGKSGVDLLPVDSEHSAVFQCLAGEERYLRRIWLTASGGPFREFSRGQLAVVTREMALHHPTWRMGPKITIDSATLMNKGLEVIEAHHLFSVDYDLIEVLVQRESAIHSMVELIDGSFLAHLGSADMRIPIQYALSYPSRKVTPGQPLDFVKLGRIHFEAPDLERFPALGLAYTAGRTGNTMPAVMNAANEVAVNAFLAGGLGFLEIAETVASVMAGHQTLPQPGLDTILEADAWAREEAVRIISRH